MSTKAIVFDLDDTLYRERRFVLSGYAAVASHVEKTSGLPARMCYQSLAGSLRRGRRPMAFQCVRDEFRLERADLDEWLGVYRNHEPRLRLPRATRRLLLDLREAWRLAVVTNGLPSVQRAKVRALGVESLVDTVVYAEDHAPGGKPHPAPLREALRRLHASPAASVAVGDDQIRDVAGARALGMRTVWLMRKVRRAEESSAGADAVIRSLEELPAALSALGFGEVEDAH